MDSIISISALQELASDVQAAQHQVDAARTAVEHDRGSGGRSPGVRLDP